MAFTLPSVRPRVGGHSAGTRFARDPDGDSLSSEVSLQVVRLDGALKITGRFGARAISEELSPSVVSGEIGPCRYVLKFHHSEYAGQVSCGGQPEDVHLRVPSALVGRSDVEIAALFTALLAR